MELAAPVQAVLAEMPWLSLARIALCIVLATKAGFLGWLAWLLRPVGMPVTIAALLAAASSIVFAVMILLSETLQWWYPPIGWWWVPTIIAHTVAIGLALWGLTARVILPYTSTLEAVTDRMAEEEDREEER